jgi:hypothetical protein
MTAAIGIGIGLGVVAVAEDLRRRAEAVGSGRAGRGLR